MQRITIQRTAIEQVFEQHDRPMSVEEILGKIRDAHKIIIFSSPTLASSVTRKGERPAAMIRKRSSPITSVHEAGRRCNCPDESKKGNAILSPGLMVFNKLGLMSAKRMKGMDHPEKSLLTVFTMCI